MDILLDEGFVKAKWADEVAELLQSGRFTSWLARLEEAKKAHRLALERHEELLTQVNLLEFRAELAHKKAIDTLERANTLEDESARLETEAADLDNASFEMVSQFEQQRSRCTDLWTRLGSLDVEIEEASARGDEPTRQKLSKQRERLGEEYEREDQKKRQLWADFEALVVRSMDRSLALQEKRQKAKLVRAEAEKLFLRYEAEAAQAQKLKAESEKVSADREAREADVEQVFEDGRRELECILGEDFAYWPAREDNKLCYATPLIRDAKSYKVPLEPGRLYRCEHRVGVAGLSPVETTKAKAVIPADSSTTKTPEPA